MALKPTKSSKDAAAVKREDVDLIVRVASPYGL
jgi:hypothetical protein